MGSVLISLCIPAVNRLEDLVQTLPFVIDAAGESPEVEIIVLDYIKNDTKEYLKKLKFPKGVSCYFCLYPKKYYHMAFARNHIAMISYGEYISISSADLIPAKNYFMEIRKEIERGSLWISDPKHFGVTTILKNEFVEAGGYDQRFEFYGPEDKDLRDRLKRRGLRETFIPEGLVTHLRKHTPEERLQNYRPGLTRGSMHRRMTKIYRENIANNVLVANAELEKLG